MKSQYLASIAVLALTACADASVMEVAPSVDKSTYRQTDGYKKPGAAVSLKHNYDGQTELGEVESINVILSERYPSGTMVVSVKTDNNLIFHNNNFQDRVDLSADEPYSFDVEVSAQQNGQFPVTISIVVESEGQYARRDETILIKVGDQTKLRAQEKAETNVPSRPKFAPVDEVITQD